MYYSIKKILAKLGSTILFITMVVSSSYSQESVSITRPMLSIRYDTLRIEYDINNCKEDDSFEIWIEANDADGNKIEPEQTDGDIGDNILCGSEKVINWVLSPGFINSNNGLFITVNGTPAPLSIQQPNLNKTKYILSSIAFPGSGLSMLHKGKPYWIMGVFGYAGLATTIHFNNRAEFIKQTKLYPDIDNRDEYNEQYQEYKKYANIAAISTGVIWATNLIWTFTSIRKVKIPGLTSKNRKIYIDLIYTPEITAPVLAFKQKF